MKTNVAAIFLGKPMGVAGWPYAELNCAERAQILLKPMRMAFPDVAFIVHVVEDSESAAAAAATLDKEDLDGVVVWPLVAALRDYSIDKFINSGKPTVLANDLYGGELYFLEALSLLKEGSPVVPVCSSSVEDLRRALGLFKGIRALRGKKIIVVEDSRNVDDQSHFWRRSYDAYIEAAKERLGVRVISISSQELMQHYQEVNPAVAAKTAEKWIADSIDAHEPKRKDIQNGARLYRAMASLLDKYGADGISIDCLNSFYTGRLPAYPCLGFFQLNNDGGLGVCEADLEAAITQLVGQILTGRPGFLSDPVIDTATSQIIYAHCVSHNKPLGKHGLSCPYKIRTHAEDRKGASVQVLLPGGYPLTTVKINILARKMAIHSATSLGSVSEERACRTKLAARAKVTRILKNWDFQTFGWHRVTFYGDFRRDFLNLATLLGLKAVKEDE